MSRFHVRTTVRRGGRQALAAFRKGDGLVGRGPPTRRPGQALLSHAPDIVAANPHPPTPVRGGRPWLVLRSTPYLPMTPSLGSSTNSSPTSGSPHRRVRAAFHRVPRHLFAADGISLDVAYANDVIITSRGPDWRATSSISEP